MTTWRIERPPDRWDMVQAVLQDPDVRTGIEFFVRRTRRRLVPARVLVQTLAHTEPGCLDLWGVLVALADHPVRPARVRCRIWPRLQSGEMMCPGRA